MTALSFIADVVGALAWPAVILAIALIFRNELTGILARLKSISAPGVFAELFGEAEAAASRLPPEQVSHGESLAKPAPSLEELVLLYPGAVILQTWGQVEQGLFSAAKQANLEMRHIRSPTRLLPQLLKEGIVDEKMFELVTYLYRIRNGIAHPRSDSVQVTSEQAREYMRLSEPVMASLPKPDDPA